MLGLVSALNRLLPFATPGTPLLQDVIHLAILCVILYLAPLLSQQLRGRVDPQAGIPTSVATESDDAIEGQDSTFGTNLDELHEAEVHIAEDTGRLHDLNADTAAPEENDDQVMNHADASNQHRARNVGAKKAKSLARKDQKRAYHEFQRSRGDAQRAKDSQSAAERELTLGSERERRRVAQMILESKKAKMRQDKRVQDQRDWEQEMRKRDKAINLVNEAMSREGMCDLSQIVKRFGQDDMSWIEKILNSSGTIGKDGASLTMLTTHGWLIRISADDMAKLYTAVANDESRDGEVISFTQLGSVLQSVVLTERCISKARS